MTDHGIAAEGVQPAGAGDFWGEFSLFPEGVLDRLYTRFWPMALVLALPYLVLLIGPIIYQNRDYLFVLDFWRWLLELITDNQNLVVSTVILVVLVFATWAFVRWRSAIPGFFRWLEDKDRVASSQSDKYERYLMTYQETLHQKGGRFVFAAIVCLLVLLYRVVTPYMPNEYLIMILIWGGLAGLAIWPLYVTGRTIRDIPKEFEVNVRPSHPDRCGGLKPLGDFCFDMVLPTVIGSIILAGVGIGGLLINSLDSQPGSFLARFQGWAQTKDVLVAFIGLFALILPLVAVSFLLPLWRFHVIMVERKRGAAEAFGRQATELEGIILANSSREGDLNAAKEASEKLEALRAVHPGDHPEWPFRPVTVVKLLVPQLLSLPGILSKAYEFLG
jgi:hypothetical protein